ncbi:DUF3429 domain-containing protein [Parvularcula dongshanensis]|uniref:DUF3429 domain-containing protein n=1 Tax=Parvularcula dongshanensis TaxID=1173995 RepID=A0A840I1X3_9PROT|nr:DUF3429 domain-containing protein [Parvularcula dongshanensis]MBB4658283.1 hypothetical protein [Parvularcula dongshanensis]
MTPEGQVRRDAQALGYAGLLPFAAGALAPWVFPAFANAFLGWLLAYGAVILSFMGGARWALAMTSPEARQGRLFSGLLAAVAPALLAWAMLVPEAILPIPLAFRLIVLGVGFALLLLDDRAGARAGEGPAWWAPLRTRLTIGVEAALAVAALRALTA